MEFASVRRQLAPWLYSGALVALASGCTTTESGVVRGDTRNQVIISVRDQKLTVIQADHTRTTFPISTSKFGFGDRRGSYATPLGQMEVAAKIGDNAPVGSVFRSRVRTGEVVGIDAPGRDAIVTRILALRGLESGNRDAWARGIYIHGTPEERNIGRPSSYGCIRMRSRDVITLYNMIRVGAKVQILDTTMSKAVASNIVTPPPTPVAPPVIAPPAAVATAVAANTSVAAPAPKTSDAATAKVLSAAIAADRKTAGAGAVAVVAPPPMSATKLVVAATPKPAVPSTPAKKEWAGAPSRLLAKANESEARAKNTRTIGAAHAGSSAPTGATETSYNSSGRELNRPVLDSL